MASGVGWSQDHTDITNHYIKMGVQGGVLLLLMFIACLLIAFQYVGKVLMACRGDAEWKQYTVWALGATLWAHSVAFVSVSYFDQTNVFFFLTLASIGSVRALVDSPSTDSMQVGSAEVTEPAGAFMPYG